MLALSYHYLLHGMALVALLCGSAFFSVCETTFFNLPRRDLRAFRQSSSRLQRMAARLLDNPGQLLNSLLFGNMVVNVLFYAVCSVLVIEIRGREGLTWAAVAAMTGFLALVLFGEILPKSLAYGNTGRMCVALAVPVFFCVRAFSPVQAVFKTVILEPALRLFVGPYRHRRTVTIEEFKSLIEASRRQGFITTEENRLLMEVVELGFLKVRHVMQPRVDMVACAVTDAPLTARRLMRKQHRTELPVFDGTIDNLLGIVPLRQILLNPGVSLDKLAQPVAFIPEQKTVESMLEHFRKTDTEMAIVVDEYGGIAGDIRMDDIAEELLGISDMAEETPSVEQLGPFEYRLAGHFPVRDWADLFGVDLAEIQQSTIGGLVSALLGKIPVPGDSISLQNIRFTVDKVHRRRITTLIVTIERLDTYVP